MSGRSRRPAFAESPPGSRIEAALRRTRAALAVIDENGAVVEASPGFAALAGAEPGGLDGVSIFDVVHADDRSVVAALLASAEAEAVIRLGSAGDFRPCAVIADSLAGDPAVRGVVLVARGVSAPGLAESEQSPERDFLVGGNPAYAYRVEPGARGGRLVESERLRALTGYADDEPAPWLAGWLAVVHPADRTRFSEEDARTERTGEPFSLDYRIVRRDGEVRRVRDRALPELDDAGCVVAWTGLLIDVTDDHDRVGLPTDAGDRARRILDRLPVAIYEQDIRPDGREGGSFINRKMADLLGYGGADWEPSWGLWEDRIHPGDREAVFAAERHCDATGEPFRMEYRMLARDGRVVWLRDEAVRTWLFPDGRQIWHGAMTDITDEVAARDALAASEARFGALVRRSHDLIAVVDRGATIRYLSPSAQRLLGFRPEDLIGTSALDRVHPDDAPALRSAIAACAEPGMETPLLRLRLRRADGSWRSFEATGANLTDEPAVGGIVFNARDVTERVAAERSLRESEARFQHFLDRTPVLALLTDADGRYLWGNEQVRRWFGIDPASLVGRSVSDWQPEAVATDVLARNRAVLETGKPAESEEQVVAADGTELVLLSIAFPLVGANNEPLVGVVAVDVAEQRRAAEAERMLAAMVESVEEAIVMRSLAGTILSWNPGAERLYGYSADEVIGSTIGVLVPPEFASEVAGATERIRRGERVGPIESRRLHRNGREIDVSYTLAPVRDETGEVVATVAVARDHSEPIRVREELRRANEELERRVVERTSQLSVVNARLTHNLTELERTQQALRQRVAAFRQQAQLLDLANDAIVVTDLGGTVVYWNAAAARLYGWSAEEAVGSPAEDLLAPALPEPVEAIVAQLERRGGWEGVVEHRRKDGSLIAVESRWALQRDDRGAPATILTINRDVTERTRIDRERADLARAARAHARRVEELAQLKDDFTAIVAHELVSPVAAIRWFAEVLAMDDLTPGEREHALATIRAETDLLHVLVDDVRAIAKVDRDDFSVVPRPVAVREIVDAAAAFARSLPGNHPFSIEGDVDGRVDADPARIGQVIRNLLGNAAKYTPAGTPIALRVDRHGPRVRIEVADEGPGIDPADAEVIFEKYRRGRQDGGRHVAGAGIGLYVGKRIAQAHGGDLTLRTQPGGGSVFGFDLEPADPAAGASHSEQK